MPLPLPAQGPASSMRARLTSEAYAEYLSGPAIPLIDILQAITFAENSPVKDSALLRALVHHTKGNDLVRVLTIALNFAPDTLSDLASTITPDQARSIPPSALYYWGHRAFAGRGLSETVAALSAAQASVASQKPRRQSP